MGGGGDVCLHNSLGADSFTSAGEGWGLGGFEKNILQVHMQKKTILAQDHRAKKNSCTYSGLKKKFWQDVPKLTHLTLLIKRFNLASELGY